MQRPPRDPKAPIISKETGLHILLLGTLAALLSLSLGRYFYSEFFSAWQTMLSTSLVFSQLLMAFAERSTRDSLFKIGLFSNPHMLGAVAITFGLQLAVVYVPVLQHFFHTVPLTGGQLLLCVAVGAAMFGAVEIKKLIHRSCCD